MARTRFLVLLAGLLAVMLLAAPAVAGGKGKGGGGGKDSPSGASLVASCDPCQAGSVVSFYGEGFDAAKGRVQLDIDGLFMVVGVAADGSVSFDWPYFQSPGVYTVSAYQEGKGKKLTLVASTNVTVTR